MSVSYPTKLALAMNSGGFCAFEKCRQHLISDGNAKGSGVIGEAAHIYGKKPTSARFDANMSDQERNSVDNLIYLCPTCHTKIDKHKDDYPAQDLLTLKRKHEAWVYEQLSEGMAEVQFAELEIAVKALMSGGHSQNTDFQVIPPDEKIEKNDLSVDSRSYIVIGLSRSHEVSSFLARMATTVDEEYPDRLRNGFVGKYTELKRVHSGDELFMAMLSFAQDGQKSFKQKAASLAILSHLFHICEIFEK